MDLQPDEKRKPACHNCELERLDEQFKEHWLLIASAGTSGESLDELSHRVPQTMLERIAEHINALPTMLERLSYHPSYEVRVAVAENLNTPHQTIFALTHDSNSDVRYSIAENHNSPPEALDLLTEDENPYVAYRAQMTLLRIGPGKTVQHLDFPVMPDEQQRHQAG